MNSIRSKPAWVLAAILGTALAVPAFANNSFNLTYSPGGNPVPVAAIITINPNGSVTITNPSGAGPYDGSDDSLIGVVNNSPNSLSSITLSGGDIFGFDGSDGIDFYIGLPVSLVDNSDTGYGGVDAFFLVTDSDHGTVHFNSPITGNGGTDYFSLEENLAASGSIQVTGTGTGPGTGGPSVPDNASTLTLLCLGLLSLGALRRKLSFAS